MKHTLGLIAAATVLAVGGGTAAWASGDDPPPGDTITDVSGDWRHGWTIEHYDGTVTYPPTIAEARAGCAALHHRVGRVRCRTRTRIWYRDLAATKVALDFARSR